MRNALAYFIILLPVIIALAVFNSIYGFGHVLDGIMIISAIIIAEVVAMYFALKILNKELL